MKHESSFQRDLIRDIETMLPDSVVMKNDASYRQGFPDLLILSGDRWAALECKRSASAGHQPNQDYYIEKLSGMGYAAFIFPENREKVLGEVAEHFSKQT